MFWRVIADCLIIDRVVKPVNQGTILVAQIYLRAHHKLPYVFKESKVHDTQGQVD